ncbi:C39 family peptidase [Deinococcus sonorensis]|uniref:C39 family peptidase n=2 Tax=Deinococcus sonorensis TaxID=309891 RepID=A0AAU7UBR8_9DEIO
MTPIGGLRHEYQRLNNCGPVTLGMAMSRWGSTQTQRQIAPLLKPTRTDKNVSLSELASYARTQGYEAYQGVAGDLSLMKKLLAAGFPVIVETWFQTPEEGGMGHYRLLTGYDDAARSFSALDSYYGPKVRMDYTRFFNDWRAYLGSYLVVYPPDQRDTLQRTLNFHADPELLGPYALKRAGLALDNRPHDAVTLYNRAAIRLRLGDAAGATRDFQAAEAAPPDPQLDPTRPGRVQGGLPWRFLWYRFEIYEAYLRTGQYADVVRLATRVLRDAPDHEEALYWRGRAYAALGRKAQAHTDLQAALQLRSGYPAARIALADLNR